MKRGLLIWLLILCFSVVFAEGTRQLMPNNTGQTYLQFNESFGGQRYFAMVDTDTIDRLFIHIAHVGEVINLGFNRLSTGGDVWFQIKNAAGTIVYGPQYIPNSSATGYINTFEEADIGPNTLVGGAGGYTPFVHTAASTGDFYIEFQREGTNSTQRNLFRYFDITVSDAADGNPIDGRVWAYAWDLNTNSFSNSSYAVFYVYSDDMYITEVDINGMQPYSFVIACNNTGSRNTGNLYTDRQSVPNANTVYPKYKIFLNPPDPLVFPVAEIPTMVENLQIIGTPTVNDDVTFYVNMTKSGTLEIYLDIDGVPGFQGGGRDIALVQHVEAGGDYIIWDGRDGLGDIVETTVSVIVSSRFSTGVTHLPVYDAELHVNGYKVTRIAPNGPEALVLYWDDSPITHGTIPAWQVITMLSGNTVDYGHNWSTDSNNPQGFGDWHTINTWWNGYEINDLASFDFTLLPIELLYWKAEFKGTYVKLDWVTGSEVNNHLFQIQRSQDGILWHTISIIPGAGNSSQHLYYSEIDETPLAGISYYRLQQIDYDGTSSFSAIQAISTDTDFSQRVKTYCRIVNSKVVLHAHDIMESDIRITTITGSDVTANTIIVKITDSIYEIDISSLTFGTYIVTAGSEQFLIYRR